ncbi:MAG: hypothetical protein QOF80_1491, partial [Verrucomicrobiota bacterium]
KPRKKESARNGEKRENDKDPTRFIESLESHERGIFGVSRPVVKRAG